MSLSATYFKKDLEFKIPGKTSRGVMNTRRIWMVKISDGIHTGYGECAPLPGLSIDENPEQKLHEIISSLNAQGEIGDLSEWPSIRFALETARLDLENKGKKILFDSPFTQGSEGILINGLIWMGDIPFMTKQIQEKMEAGFKCIKIKIGGLDLNTELELLSKIREDFSSSELEIRLDANGAFEPKNALEKLKQLSEFDIHSIEQPLKQGQIEEMARIVNMSPIPIALDEELIKVTQKNEKVKLLNAIKPDYIILKPSLMGGIKGSQEWIDLAENLNIGWWITSALESNIGLNALAQWVATLKSEMPQGLGTGQVFSNNFPSPLFLKGENLFYAPDAEWKID